jgi:hypothetical protein
MVMSEVRAILKSVRMEDSLFDACCYSGIEVDSE